MTPAHAFRSIVASVVVATGLTACSSHGAARPPATTGGAVATTSSSGGFLADPANVYADAGPNMLSPAVRDDPPRVYVPNSLSGTVSVIDPAARRVIATYPTGPSPQHVVPSYDLATLWVNNNGGSLTAIDPRTATPTKTVPVADPYNMYFTPDGSEAIIVAESLQRLDFRDPHTLALHQSVDVPCMGVNHLDYSADGSYFVASCEFDDAIIKFDLATRRVVGRMTLPHPGGMPQDVRLAPNGRLFYVADLVADGVYLIDGDSFTNVGFIPTGPGTHGLYPSRDGRRFFVINRGTSSVYGQRHPPGSISVLDVATNRVTATWPVPGGGSPDMGNLTADGSQLWVAGRYDDEVYCFDTTSGQLLARIPVGRGPHGLTVWPQPGRFSLGHTGNMR